MGDEEIFGKNPCPKSMSTEEIKAPIHLQTSGSVKAIGKKEMEVILEEIQNWQEVMIKHQWNGDQFFQDYTHRVPIMKLRAEKELNSSDLENVQWPKKNGCFQEHRQKST